jgi:tRNA G18 (ribose-2'-O)-methylase SpoU
LQGVTGGGGSSSSNSRGVGGGGGEFPRRVENKPPSPSFRRPGATSELFQYHTQPRTVEASYTTGSSGGASNGSSNYGGGGTSSSASGSEKVTTDAFSFRIGTRFQGFEATTANGPSSAPPSVASASSSTTISSEEVQFDTDNVDDANVNARTVPPASSRKHPKSVKKSSPRSFELDEDAEYEKYLEEQAGDEEEGMDNAEGGRTRAAEDGEEPYAREEDEGGSEGEEAVFNEEEQHIRDEQAKAEREAKAIKLRTMLLNKQLRRMTPAVRDWHALSASRKKVLVVEMDAKIEVRRDELAPYLPPESQVRTKHQDEDGDMEEVSATKKLSSTDLWRCSKLLRVSRHARESQRTIVTGGKTAICRIWKEYGIVPNVVYCPDDEPIPQWCLDATTPSSSTAADERRFPIVVRAPGAAINKDLLSAELNDGFAAEFTLGSDSPIFRYGTSTFSGRTDINVNKDASEAAEEALRAAVTSHHSTAGLDPALLFQDPKHTKINLRAAMFLTESRIPSNVGLSIKAAVDNGYSAVILDRCVDMLNEKVIRASDGTIFNPRAKIFQLNPHFGVDSPLDAAEVVQKACLRHNLLPLVTVPSQDGDAMPAFQVAQELFYAAEKHDAVVKAEAMANATGNCSSNSDAENASASSEANGGSDDRTDEEKLNALALIHRDQSTAPPPQGAMLMLGSEAMGLHRVMQEWEAGTYAESVPFSAVTLEMPDFRVTSINVAVAGGILMRMFRPAARREHRELFRLGVVPDGAESVNLLSTNSSAVAEKKSATEPNVSAETASKEN